MGTRQTLDTLKAYASLLDDCGDTGGADSVRALVSALSAAGDGKIKATVTKVLKAWGGDTHRAVSAVGLFSRLRSLNSVLGSGGAKATAADIGHLVQLLDVSETVTPEMFEASLRDAISAPPPPKKAAKSKRVPLSDAELRKWADKLTAMTTDQTAFEALLADIQAIPGLSVPELHSIAGHYLGYEAPKTKAGIFKKLRSRQMQDAIEAGRRSRIQRIAV